MEHNLDQIRRGDLTERRVTAYAPSREHDDGSTECTEPQLKRCPLNQLRPHPAYTKRALSVSTSRINELERLGNRVFDYPISVTQDGLIIDGYARWEIAKRQSRATILCFVLHKTEDEALSDFLGMHRPVKSLSKFRLIELSTELQCSLTQNECLDQPTSARIPPAPESLAQLNWVRRRARVVGVSLASIRKVDYVLEHGSASTIQAARDGKISIHRAALWSQEGEHQQQENLRQLHIRRLKQKAAYQVKRVLLSRSKTRALELTPPTLLTLLRPLSTMSFGKAEEFGAVTVARLKVPGKGIYLTEELLTALKPENEVLLE